MKQVLLAVVALSAVSVACSVDPFSNISASTGGAEAGAGQAGAPDAAGSPSAPASGSGGSAGKLTTGRGGKGTGGAATGGSGAGTTGGTETAGAAGEPGTGGSATGAGAGGTAGSTAGAGPAGSSSGGAGAGSGGSAAGMPGTGGTGTVTPSCSASDAFSRSAAPAGPLTMDAWSAAFAADNVCWKQEASSCSFTVDSWGPSPTDAARYRLYLSDVTCNKPVRYGSGSADSCKVDGTCDAFNGGGSSMIAIDFDLTPNATGAYIATNMEMAGSILGGSNCEFSQSPGADMLTTGAEELLSAMTFPCGQ